MKTKHFYFASIAIFTIYLIWVWFFSSDYSTVPYAVRQAWFNQDMPHWLLPDSIMFYVYDARKAVAFVSLALLLFYNKFGRLGFLIFSITGPLLHSHGWGYELNWVTNLEWAIQMMQGGLIAVCFVGRESKKFSWSFNKPMQPTANASAD